MDLAHGSFLTKKENIPFNGPEIQEVKVLAGLPGCEEL